MITIFARQLVSVGLSVLLVILTIPADLAAQSPPAGSSQPAPSTAEELQQLVAPIALYPDALVAQVLGATTFPDQVAYADDWLHQNQTLLINQDSVLLQKDLGKTTSETARAMTLFDPDNGWGPVQQ
jgi:hypothetical protein